MVMERNKPKTDDSRQSPESEREKGEEAGHEVISDTFGEI